ncbi:MAG: hypothetical protein EXQ48_05915 [Acidobacteria bacterium]|nr:hypothetical protein [Acidobacteriota bacterium]
MRKSIVFAVLGLTLLTPSAWAQDAPETISAARRAGPPKGPVPRLPTGQPDLGDVAWLTMGGGNFKEFDALMLPLARKLLAERDVTQDPHNYCMPDVVPRTTPFPLRFFQNYTNKAPTHLVIVYEGNIHSFRQIFMDGRKHPEYIDPLWYGHSIGWWEKDTLVIDTVGFNDTSWYDGRGTPHSEQLHTVERYTRLDKGRLELKVTIDDPAMYSKPFVVTINATTTTGDEVMEYICQDGNQYGIGTLPTPAQK